jgi:acetylornithine aminotransferase
VRATIEILRSDDIYGKVSRQAPVLKEALTRFSCVEQVRGEGFLLGLQLRGPAGLLQKELFNQGVLAGTADDPNVLRLMPPLTISDAEIDEFLARFQRAERAFCEKSK